MDNKTIQYSRPVPPYARYCAPIIPTMFDDSLSYYETLCALNNFLQHNVIDKLNEVIEQTNTLSDFIYNLNLHDYVDQVLKEYIDNGTFYETLRYDGDTQSLTLTFDMARN